MWCYNIIWDNEGSIYDLLQLDPITPGSVLITTKLVELKRGIPETILTVKIIDWRKFIDYFGRSIEADPSRVGKNNAHFVRIGYTPRPSCVNLPISRHQLEKGLNLELPKLRLYQLTKNLAAEIAPHISSAFRDLGVIFEKSILSSCTKLVDADPEGS